MRIAAWQVAALDGEPEPRDTTKVCGWSNHLVYALSAAAHNLENRCAVHLREKNVAADRMVMRCKVLVLDAAQGRAASIQIVCRS